MTAPRLVSSRFPYLPIRLQVRQRVEDLEALLDTGFDDDDEVVAPRSWMGGGQHVIVEP